MTSQDTASHLRRRALSASVQMPSVPGFTADYRKKLPDTLDYPPKGSPKAGGR